MVDGGEVFFLLLEVILLPVIVVCILVLIVFPGLQLAAIAFLPERKVDIVAVKADPVTLPGAATGFGGLWLLFGI